MATFKSINHPSWGRGSSERMLFRVCPCGCSLGMYPESERQTCGDQDCIDYLEQNPEWYEDEDEQ